MDEKEKTLKAIKKNHEDGLTQSEIKQMFDFSRYEVEVILKELQIEQRIRSIRKGRFLLYKAVTK
jgi:predicted transcriptional regulator